MVLKLKIGYVILQVLIFSFFMYVSIKSILPIGAVDELGLGLGSGFILLVLFLLEGIISLL